jgi:hypothetical protein
MANSFTPTRTSRFGGPNNKTFVLVEGTLVIDTTASGGGAVDDLPASMFNGLSKIVCGCGVVNDGEDKGYQAVPDYTGDSLLITGGTDAAFQDLPNDTYKLAIIGLK